MIVEVSVATRRPYEEVRQWDPQLLATYVEVLSANH